MKARESALLALFTLMLFAGSCTKKISTLNLLVWEGYADASFIKAFEEQHHCKVSASYMGSSDELVAKLRGGSAGNRGTHRVVGKYVTRADDHGICRRNPVEPTHR